MRPIVLLILCVPLMVAEEDSTITIPDDPRDFNGCAETKLCIIPISCLFVGENTLERQSDSVMEGIRNKKSCQLGMIARSYNMSSPTEIEFYQVELWSVGNAVSGVTMTNGIPISCVKENEKYKIVTFRKRDDDNFTYCLVNAHKEYFTSDRLSLQDGAISADNKDKKFDLGKAIGALSDGCPVGAAIYDETTTGDSGFDCLPEDILVHSEKPLSYGCGDADSTLQVYSLDKDLWVNGSVTCEKAKWTATDMQGNGVATIENTGFRVRCIKRVTIPPTTTEGTTTGGAGGGEVAPDGEQGSSIFENQGLIIGLGCGAAVVVVVAILAFVFRRRLFPCCFKKKPDNVKPVHGTSKTSVSDSSVDKAATKATDKEKEPAVASTTGKTPAAASASSSTEKIAEKAKEAPIVNVNVKATSVHQDVKKIPDVKAPPAPAKEQPPPPKESNVKKEQQPPPKESNDKKEEQPPPEEKKEDAKKEPEHHENSKYQRLNGVNPDDFPNEEASVGGEAAELFLNGVPNEKKADKKVPNKFESKRRWPKTSKKRNRKDSVKMYKIKGKLAPLPSPGKSMELNSDEDLKEQDAEDVIEVMRLPAENDPVKMLPNGQNSKGYTGTLMMANMTRTQCIVEFAPCSDMFFFISPKKFGLLPKDTNAPELTITFTWSGKADDARQIKALYYTITTDHDSMDGKVLLEWLLLKEETASESSKHPKASKISKTPKIAKEEPATPETKAATPEEKAATPEAGSKQKSESETPKNDEKPP